MKLKEFKEILKTGNYDKIKPLLRMEVRNKETLRDCDFYFTIIGDIVKVITAYAELDDYSQVTTILPHTIVDKWLITQPSILMDVMENTPSNFNLGRLFDIVECRILHKNKTSGQYPLDKIKTLTDSNNPLDSIIVVNIDSSTRVSILQFPNLLHYVYNKIGNYYIVPSSVYEMFIIPENKMPDIDHMNEVIEQVNKTTVEPEDVLGHKLLKYDNSGLSEC